MALAAGVSAQTVSNALNEPDKLRPATLKSVLGAIEKVGYQPSFAARALRAGRSHTIALVTFDEGEGYCFERPYHGRILNGVLEALDVRNYKALLHLGEPNRLAGLKTLFDQGQVDGALVLSAVLPRKLIRQVIALGHPVSFLDRKVPNAICAYADYGAGMREAIDQLWASGCRKFVYLAGTTAYEASSTPVLRLKAYREALLSHGVPESRIVVVDTQWTPASGHQETLALARSRRSPPDAIMTASDDIAVGALAAARELGWSVPDKVRIVGFDDGPTARFAAPSLSSVHLPVEELARCATDRLIEMIEKRPVAASHALMTRFVQRDS